MVYKYLIKEAKVGDIKTDKGVKSTVTSIDPITKSISWDIDYVPAFDSTFKEFTELRRFITKLSRDTKDETIDKIADEVTNSFNKYRTHIRKNYPEQYKKAKINELDLSHHMELGNDWGEVIFYLEKYGTDEEIDAYITAFKEQAGPYFDDSNFDHVKEFQKWVKTAMRTDEISTSGGAGAYNTPYAFKLVKKQKKIEENKSYARISKPRFVKDKNNPNFLNVYIDYDLGSGGSSIALGKETMTGQIRRESAAKAMKLAGEVAKDLEAKYNLEDIEIVDLENGKVRIFAVSDDFINRIKENIGATLGPGPKAGPEGVKDNAYVKQFKYKLVPKTKKGTYVQKGSGLDVKKLF